MKQKEKQQRAHVILDTLKTLYPNAKTILNFSNHWELLVAVMLSAQTTDKQVNIATKTFFKKYPRLHDIVHAKPQDIAHDLRSINYYKTKAKHIHESANILVHHFNAIVPKNTKDLMSLPGVGRKTALVVLGNAYGIVEGIAVDTHVERLTKVFKLSEKNTPENIEKDLQKLFPKEEWFSLTNRMINYGREHCHARCTHKICPILSLLQSKKLL